LQSLEDQRQQTWLRAVAETAKEQNAALPPFTGHAMGNARTKNLDNGRFVTFKRRLVSKAQAAIDGIEWTLWLEQDDLPLPVAAFRESQEAKPEKVRNLFSLLKGWLLDGWTVDEAKAAVGKHPLAQLEAVPG
jgi:hypothetical protein